MSTVTVITVLSVVMALTGVIITLALVVFPHKCSKIKVFAATFFSPQPGCNSFINMLFFFKPTTRPRNQVT